jgi:hypothetical protein
MACYTARMLNVELVRDCLTKVDEMVDRQVRVVQRLEAEEADTTEAEHLLAYWAAARNFFEKRLAAALRQRP